MYTYIAINSLLLSWEPQWWGRFAFQLTYKLGVLLLGQVCHLQLFLRWEFQLELGYLYICWQGSGIQLHGLLSYAAKSNGLAALNTIA